GRHGLDPKRLLDGRHLGTLGLGPDQRLLELGDLAVLLGGALQELVDATLLLLDQAGQWAVVLDGRNHRPGWIKLSILCRSPSAAIVQAVVRLGRFRR